MVSSKWSYQFSLVNDAIIRDFTQGKEKKTVLSNFVHLKVYVHSKWAHVHISSGDSKLGA